MQDPQPENITGEKQVVHSVEHRINWGYVILGVAAIYVTWKARGIFSSSSSSETKDDRADRDEIGGAEILVEDDQR